MRVAQRATAVLGLVLTLAVGVASVASAAEQQVVRGRYLELVSVLPDGADRLSPGVTVDWLVGISAPGAAGPAAEPGSIDRALRADGELASYLQVRVAPCTGPAAADCTGASLLAPTRAVTGGREIDLGSQPAHEQQWLLVQVSLPADVPPAAQSLTGTLQLVARGAGEELAIGTDGTGEVSSGGVAETGASGSAGPDGSAGTGAASEGAPAQLDPPIADGSLAGTGVQPALWLLAAGAAVLVGAAMRSQRREHPAEDADERSRA